MGEELGAGGWWRVGAGGSLAPHLPLPSQETTMISGEEWEWSERASGRVVENPLQILGLGSVELIQCVAGKSSLQ